MATNQNNVHTSSFNKGMNSDTSYDLIGDGQYIFGQNIRITTNSLLTALSDSNSTEGIIAPVNAGKDASTEGMYEGQYEILATASIENIGAVVVAKDKKWYVYRIDFKQDPIKFSKQFESEEYDELIKDKFSVVINKETKDIIKLYIADGVHQLMQIDLLDDEYNEKISGNTDNITSNRIYPSVQMKIVKQISGSLKTSQVQYTYRLYKRYGISSRLAPLTNKIQIIDSNRNKEDGNAEDTQTSIGLRLQIPLDELDINKNIFDHVQVFRLSYVKAQSNADVQLIYEAGIQDSQTNGIINIDDNGLSSIQDLSIDEFSAINSMNLIPQTIEQNQNYIFIGNVKDETKFRIDQKNININSKSYQRRFYQNGQDSKFVLRDNADGLYGASKTFTDINDIPQNLDVNPTSIINRKTEEIKDWEYCKYCKSGNDVYFGGEGPHVNFKFVTAEFSIHDNYDYYYASVPKTVTTIVDSYLSYIKQDGTLQQSTLKVSDYLKQHGISAQNSSSYDDIIYSSMLRSLKRDEVYRYGIVYYNKYGKRSDVQWIGDFRSPTCKESNPFTVKTSNYSGVITTDISAKTLFGIRLNEHGAFKRDTMDIKSVSASIEVCKAPVYGMVTLGTFTSYTKGPSGGKIKNDDPGGIKKICVDNEDKIRYFAVYEINGAKYAPGTQIYVAKGTSIRVNIEHIFMENHIVKYDTDDWYAYRDTRGSDLITSDGAYIKELTNLAQSVGCRYKYPDGDGGCGFNDYGFQAYFSVEAQLKFAAQGSVSNSLCAHPLGVQFDVSIPKNTGITSFQIVRCSKAQTYSKTIMQCALSRPISQSYGNINQSGISRSPYYPTPFLHSGFFATKDYLHLSTANNLDNNSVMTILSPEISLFPEDSKSLLSGVDSTIHTIKYAYGGKIEEMSLGLNGFREDYSGDIFQTDEVTVWYNRHKSYGASAPEALDFKTDQSCCAYYYKDSVDFKNSLGALIPNRYSNIRSVSEAKNPTWEQGFSNIQLSGSKVLSGVKAYKSYVSSILEDSYVNWVANGMYNLRITNQESQSGIKDDDYDFWKDVKAFTYLDTEDDHSGNRDDRAKGWIGPGPQCLIIKASDTEGTIFDNTVTCDELQLQPTIGSVICNIEHTAQQFAGISPQEKQFDIYYGFGNFCNLKDDGNGNMTGSMVVFDGDTYLMPCELVSMYKAYNFNSIKDTIPSAQVVNYVPMETKINTFFDYGMNYRNTFSTNLQTEPGEITGIATQERPQHQYNPIYSDNNISNDVYNAQSEENSEQNFTQRIFYSQLKINGENIDNWFDFRALDYIDADTRYGEITHMLTRKDILYFWQTSAFGKLSVNERSLVKDENSNTIQLGQGGVLQRTDYIDTKHGIRMHDKSAISTNDGIFWIDVTNKAILANSNDQVIDYGERVNVQNILNEQMTDGVPYIEYDAQNYELLCKCLSNDNQIVFNTKLNCATGIYTRNYIDTILYNNVVYGLSIDKITKYNYLTNKDSCEYLSPVILKFVVNQNGSTTKVFDTQQIITMKRDYDEDFAEEFMRNKEIVFETNIGKSQYDHNYNQVVTDRESNLTYAIPRQDNADYGNRLRGRWMTVSITDYNPKYDFAISHILTKYRQSFT